MNATRSARLAAIAAGLALCLACEAAGTAEPSATNGPPRAANGTLDLTNHDLGADPVRLDGEWDLYWDQLLTPNDLRALEDPLTPDAPPNLETPRTAPPRTTLTLPGSWKGHDLDGRRLGHTGQATLRLRVLPGPNQGPLAVRLFDLASAWRLWANGALVAEEGVVGTSADTEEPSFAVHVVPLHNDAGPLELVLQVSNHHRPAGGVAKSIRLGTEERLLADQVREWTTALFFVGILLAMGVYHLVLFGFRPKNPAPLAFGLYCLLWMGVYFTGQHSAWAIRIQLPGLPGLPLEQVSLVFFYLTLPTALWFFVSLYPGEFSRRLLRVQVALSTFFAVSTLAFPVWALRDLLPLAFGWSVVLIVYCLTILVVALRRRRSGAGFILMGFFVLGVLSINDMLVDQQLIRSVSLIHHGMVLFVAFQALALAHQFSRSFSAVEALSTQLDAKNRAQQAEMAERARLEKELVGISEQERRHLSRELHDGLCQKLVGARLRCSALERSLDQTGGDPGAVAPLTTLLEESVTDAYDLVRGLWPVDDAPYSAGAYLEELARHHANATGLAIEVRQNLGCAQCDGEHVGQLVRIGQEALLNAVKHAKASRIELTLECGPDKDCFRLTVRDDGVGRARATGSSGGMGTRIMAHRTKLIDGDLRVTDAPGGGTLVVCEARCARQGGAETHARSA